jgi:4-hydroxy-tetrahydrodipicolinate reductase
MPMFLLFQELQAGIGSLRGNGSTMQGKEWRSFISSSNFSLGVNIFLELNAYLAKMTSKFKNSLCDYGGEIHHTLKKLDAPSGTVLSLAEGVIQK